MRNILTAVLGLALVGAGMLATSGAQAATPAPCSIYTKPGDKPTKHFQADGMFKGGTDANGAGAITGLNEAPIPLSADVDTKKVERVTLNCINYLNTELRKLEGDADEPAPGTVRSNTARITTLEEHGHEGMEANAAAIGGWSDSQTGAKYGTVTNAIEKQGRTIAQIGDRPDTLPGEGYETLWDGVGSNAMRLDKHETRLDDHDKRIVGLEEDVDDLKGGIAGAMAMASMPSLASDKNFAFTGGAAFYEGKGGAALGVQARLTPSLTLQGNASYGGGIGVGGGMSYAW